MNTLERMAMSIRGLEWQVRVPKMRWNGFQPSRYYKKSAGTIGRMAKADVEVL